MQLPRLADDVKPSRRYKLDNTEAPHCVGSDRFRVYVMMLVSVSARLTAPSSPLSGVIERPGISSLTIDSGAMLVFSVVGSQPATSRVQTPLTRYRYRHWFRWLDIGCESQCQIIGAVSSFF